jgi:hypothetical protein
MLIVFHTDPWHLLVKSYPKLRSSLNLTPHVFKSNTSFISIIADYYPSLISYPQIILFVYPLYVKVYVPTGIVVPSKRVLANICAILCAYKVAIKVKNPPPNADRYKSGFY